ncbi:hypothetical protein [Metaclostridioides mangenotii]|uniref:hypothetical protein n=1 Tax=Metaclostridioides mangenotii TaxID=1540 RepID=UPI0004885BFA|nr:hypothetical protein [Clostridioides mangenotii]
MQDIKRNRRKMGNNSPVSTVNNTDIEETFEDPFFEDDMERGFKHKKHNKCDPCHDHHDNCDCDPCHDHDDNCKCHDHHDNCECHDRDDNCGCHDNFDCDCDQCELKSNECFKNNCGPECCRPIRPKDFSPQNSIPIAIDTNRVFDTMRFQEFTDATGPNGEPLVFKTEVVEVNGHVPHGGPVSVTIEKICVSFDEIIINPGMTTLENFDLTPVESIPGRNCETIFDSDVCPDQINRECCRRGLGTTVAFKERGLSVEVHDLVLELRGKCGCTTFTALAFPAVCENGCKRKVPFVQFNFNTLSAPICCPSDGRAFQLRQQFNTHLTVDCIGKSILKFDDRDDCEFDLIIPNDIDLILCLEETVSTLITEQIVVLGSRNPLEPRLVDTFAKVCDFDQCKPRN